MPYDQFININAHLPLGQTPDSILIGRIYTVHSHSNDEWIVWMCHSIDGLLRHTILLPRPHAMGTASPPPAGLSEKCICSSVCHSRMKRWRDWIVHRTFRKEFAISGASFCPKRISILASHIHWSFGFY